MTEEIAGGDNAGHAISSLYEGLYYYVNFRMYAQNIVLNTLYTQKHIGRTCPGTMSCTFASCIFSTPAIECIATSDICQTESKKYQECIYTLNHKNVAVYF